MVILTIPYDGHDELVVSLREVAAGKIVITCVNPLGFDKQGAYGLEVPAGSAAESAAALLPKSTVVGAFHHLSAVTLISDDPPPEHVLVVGDDKAAKQVVIDLMRAVTQRPGVDAGRLRLASSARAADRSTHLDQPRLQGALRRPRDWAPAGGVTRI